MTEPTDDRPGTTAELALLRPFGHPMTEPTDDRLGTTADLALIRPLGHPMTEATNNDAAWTGSSPLIRRFGHPMTKATNDRPHDRNDGTAGPMTETTARRWSRPPPATKAPDVVVTTAPDH